MKNVVSPHGGFFTTGTILFGTHEQNATLKALSKELERLKPFGEHGLINEAKQGYETDDLSEDTKAEIIHDLHVALNNIAAAHGNYYFGNHPDDGADLGFWEHTTEDEA